jgi:hypothetical protein
VDAGEWKRPTAVEEPSDESLGAQEKVPQGLYRLRKNYRFMATLIKRPFAGAKALPILRALPARLNSLLKKAWFRVEFAVNGARAEARSLSFKQLMARVNSCPFAHLRSHGSFSASCEVVPLLQSQPETSFSAACKAQPSG